MTARMPLRDADLRQAAHEDGIRPGDKAWSLLRELQARRDAEGERTKRRQLRDLSRSGRRR